MFRNARNGLDDMNSYGTLKGKSIEWVKAFCRFLISQGYLQEHRMQGGGFGRFRPSFTIVKLTAQGRKLVHDPSARMPPCPPSMELRLIMKKTRNYKALSLAPQETGLSRPVSWLDEYKFRRQRSFGGSLKRSSSEAGLGGAPPKRAKTVQIAWTGPLAVKEECENAPLSEELRKEFNAMLIKFRKKQSEIHQIPSYQVMNRELLGFLADVRPDRVAYLPETVDDYFKANFAEKVCRKIGKFCKLKQLSTNNRATEKKVLDHPTQPANPFPEFPVPEETDEKRDTYAAWQSGDSISDICRKKTRRRKNVVTHLCDMILLGKEFDWSRLEQLTSRNQYLRVYNILSKHGIEQPLSAIKERTGVDEESISFCMVRYILEYTDYSKKRLSDIPVKPEYVKKEIEALPVIPEAPAPPPVAKKVTKAEIKSQKKFELTASSFVAQLEEGASYTFEALLGLVRASFNAPAAGYEAALTALVEEMEENFVLIKSGDKYELLA